MPNSYYTINAQRLTEEYNAVDAGILHKCWLQHLPKQAGMACDIGAGTGRDANWLAEQGWEVVAVEPEQALQALAKPHSHPRVTWLNDKLPDLQKLRVTGHRFNVILLSAVWMHVPPRQRERAFRILTDLLAPGGILVISLRHSTDQEENKARGFFSVSREELDQLARQKALASLDAIQQADVKNRPLVRWETLVYQLPDDGTGSLPLLRHIIVNDDKSSTYKLGLLRVLIRIAEGAPGMVTQRDETSIEIPFGLVGLYWLQIYLPLVLKHNVIQTPSANHELQQGYGWANSHFWHLVSLSANDLRIGASFQGEDAKHVIGAINRACQNIQAMPAKYITWPGTQESVFACDQKSKRSRQELYLDRDTLCEFGTFKIPVELWQCMGQFACWLEPAIINEWIPLMDRWNHLYNKQTYMEALQWSEAIRSTSLARQCADSLKTRLVADGARLHCVWSNRALNQDYDIDHCFPWSRWFNNDLWNLMPANKKINQEKSEKLPSAPLMQNSRQRILTWWESGYCQGEQQRQFYTEAQAALPLLTEVDLTLEQVFDAVLHQRARLKANQQLVEWTLGRATG